MDEKEIIEDEILIKDTVSLDKDKRMVSKVLNVFKKIVFMFLFLELSTYASPIFLINIFDKESALLIVVSVLLFGFGLWYILRRYRKQLDKKNPNGFGFHKIEKKFVIYSIILLILNIVIMNVISMFIEGAPENEQILTAFSEKMPWLLLFGTVVAAPILEELVFRGIFFNYFFNENSRFHNIMAVLVSGLLFGLMHEMSLSPQLLLYSSMGWMFGLTYMITKDIRYSMGIHLVNNLLASIPLILTLLNIQ